MGFTNIDIHKGSIQQHQVKGVKIDRYFALEADRHSLTLVKHSQNDPWDRPQNIELRLYFDSSEDLESYLDDLQHTVCAMRIKRATDQSSPTPE